MMAIDPVTGNRRIVDAYARSKAIYDQKALDGAACSESVSTIYELLAEMGVVEDDGNKIELNLK